MSAAEVVPDLSGGTAPPAPGGTAPGGEQPAPFEWKGELGQEFRGLAEAKKWNSTDQLARGYQELEKFHGVPPERLVKLPGSDAKPEDWEAVYSRMGRPEKPEGYTIRGVEGLEQLDLESPTTQWYLKTAHQIGMSDRQVQNLMRGYLGEIERLHADDESAFMAKKTAEYGALKSKWGEAYDQNLGAARRASQEYGITPDDLEVLYRAKGFAWVAERLAKMGAPLAEHGGEHRAGGGRLATGHLMTPAAAEHEISQLMADSAFMARVERKDVEAVKRWDDLHTLAYPEV